MNGPWEINTSHRISGLDQRGSVFKLRENAGCFSAGRSRVAVTRPARPERKYYLEVMAALTSADQGRLCGD